MDRSKKGEHFSAEFEQLIRENEKSANLSIARVMEAVVCVCALGAIMFLLRIYTVTTQTPYILLGMGVVLSVEIVVCRLNGGSGAGQKYIMTASLLISIFIANCLIGYKIWMLMGLPILFTCRYSNKKFTIVTGLMAAVLTIASSFTNAYLAWFTRYFDLNMVSYNTPGTLEYSRYLFSDVLKNGLDERLVLHNSLLLSAVPNILIIILLVLGCINVITNNQRMLLNSYENTEREKLLNEKLAEQNLIIEDSKEELERKTLILENAGVGVWSLLLKNGVEPRMRCNQKIQEILGCIEETLSEEDFYAYWFNRIAEQDFSKVRVSMKKMMSGVFSEVSFGWHHPQKGMITIRVGGIAQHTEDRSVELNGYCADVTNVTIRERHQQEELAKALEKEENENRDRVKLLGKLLEDIEGPMTDILDYEQQAEQNIGQQEALKNALCGIKEASAALRNDLNELAALEKAADKDEDM